MPLIHTTANGVAVYTFPGKKGPNDFIVKYMGPKRYRRTPKHIHMAADLLIKRTANLPLTNKLLDYIVNDICMKVQPSASNEPILRIFDPQQTSVFDALNGHGEYSVEFLLVVIELIQTQEITNYPQGQGHYSMYAMIKEGADIFSIITSATR